MIAAWAVSAAHAQEPLTFKGQVIGAERAAILEAFPHVRCRDDRCFYNPATQCAAYEPYKSACLETYGYGGILPLLLAFHFPDGRLASVNLTIRGVDFPGLVAAFVERFGKPTSDQVEAVQTMAGAKLDNRQVLWKRGGISLMASQRSRRLDEAAISLVSDAALARDRRQLQQKAKEAAKTL